ncbi:MAG: NifB/NifX family molybdenum-iron cluster-binding protein [Candidatus Asgardarchaeia archaeon]
MEKIAVSSTDSNGMDSTVNFTFARCAFFTIISLENGNVLDVKVIRNEAAQLSRGAGIQAAQLMASQGVNVVITGNIGPNAYNSLQSLGIKVYSVPSVMKVRDAVKAYVEGKLNPASAMTGRGRGAGMGRGAWRL